MSRVVVKGSVHPDLRNAVAYAQPVWHFDDESLKRVIHDFGGIAAELENQRLRLISQDKDAVALADLNKWSIDHQAFGRAIPFSRSLLREADRSDIVLTLAHEVIHMQSALGWLGINLAALRIAATECELRLLARSGELPGADQAAGSPALSLATLRDPAEAGYDTAMDILALVEQQLELVRKAQLLRATWPRGWKASRSSANYRQTRRSMTRNPPRSRTSCRL